MGLAVLVLAVFSVVLVGTLSNSGDNLNGITGAVVVDLDEDGVDDAEDLCPNTAAGETAYSDGCSENDYLAEYDLTEDDEDLPLGDSFSEAGVTLSTSSDVELNTFNVDGNFIEAIVSEGSGTITYTFSNLQPSTTYYKYTEDEYTTPETLSTDASGELSFSENTDGETVRIVLKTTPSTFVASVDCTAPHSIVSGVCVLGADVADVVIADMDIDFNGFTVGTTAGSILGDGVTVTAFDVDLFSSTGQGLIAGFDGNGIVIDSIDRTTVNDIRVEDVDLAGIVILDADDVTIGSVTEDVEIDSVGTEGLFSDDSNIIDVYATITNTGADGVFIQDGDDIEVSADVNNVHQDTLAVGSAPMIIRRSTNVKVFNSDIDGNSPVGVLNCLTFSGNGIDFVEADNNDIMNCDVGINSFTAPNVNLHHNEITTTTEPFRVSGSVGGLVTDNIIVDGGLANVRVAGTTVTIRDNSFTYTGTVNTPTALGIIQGAEADVIDNDIIESVRLTTGSHALISVAADSSANIRDNTLTCLASETTCVGIRMTGLTNLGKDITNNDIIGSKQGIVVQDKVDILIDNNRIDVSGGDGGIDLETSLQAGSVTVQHNQIRSATRCFGFQADAGTGHTYDSNDCEAPVGVGWNDQYPTGTTFTRNIFETPTGALGPLQATLVDLANGGTHGNWWGNCHGPLVDSYSEIQNNANPNIVDTKTLDRTIVDLVGKDVNDLTYAAGSDVTPGCGMNVVFLTDGQPNCPWELRVDGGAPTAYSVNEDSPLFVPAYSGTTEAKIGRTFTISNVCASEELIFDHLEPKIIADQGDEFEYVTLDGADLGKGRVDVDAGTISVDNRAFDRGVVSMSTGDTLTLEQTWALSGDTNNVITGTVVYSDVTGPADLVVSYTGGASQQSFTLPTNVGTVFRGTSFQQEQGHYIFAQEGGLEPITFDAVTGGVKSEEVHGFAVNYADGTSDRWVLDYVMDDLMSTATYEILDTADDGAESPIGLIFQVIRESETSSKGLRTGMGLEGNRFTVDGTAGHIGMDTPANPMIWALGDHNFNNPAGAEYLKIVPEATGNGFTIEKPLPTLLYSLPFVTAGAGATLKAGEDPATETTVVSVTGKVLSGRLRLEPGKIKLRSIEDSELHMQIETLAGTEAEFQGGQPEGGFGSFKTKYASCSDLCELETLTGTWPWMAMQLRENTAWQISTGSIQVQILDADGQLHSAMADVLNPGQTQSFFGDVGQSIRQNSRTNCPPPCDELRIIGFEVHEGQQYAFVADAENQISVLAVPENFNGASIELAAGQTIGVSATNSLLIEPGENNTETLNTSVVLPTGMNIPLPPGQCYEIDNASQSNNTIEIAACENNTETLVVTTENETDNGTIEIEPGEEVEVSEDLDGDGVMDVNDDCVATPGATNLNGCTAAFKMKDIIHVHYHNVQGGYACIKNGNQKKHCKLPLQPGELGDSRDEEITFSHTKIFRKSELGLTDWQVRLNCDEVYDETEVPGVSPVVQQDDVTDRDIVGVPGVDDYVVAKRIHVYDPLDDTTRQATLCRNHETNDFKFGLDENGNLVNSLGDEVAKSKKKAVKLVRTSWWTQQIKVSVFPSIFMILFGSELEVTYPEEAVWEEEIDDFVYPYVFETNDTWDVDVCEYVPEGYNITGVYDEDGGLISTTNCIQTVVANEMKIVAFQAIETGSPDVFSVTLDLTATPEGEAPQNVVVETQTMRVPEEETLVPKDVAREMAFGGTTLAQQREAESEVTGAVVKDAPERSQIGEQHRTQPVVRDLAPSAQPVKKGFWCWLKGLFGQSC